MSNQPEAAEGTRVVLRRRRTRRHRRNRLIRRALVVACAIVTCGCSLVALRYLSPSLFQASRGIEPTREAVEASRQDLINTQQDALSEMEGRKIYPYSIVPGGVKDARELKWAADHDPVVAEHYAGFDYGHARVVRLTAPRAVYVSYRIGKHVYWTRRVINLKTGETVLTDGKITARTRCGNRVEEVPQQATSQSEPPASKFEEPIAASTGTAMSTPPVPFESSLNRTPPPGLGPAPPLTLYDPMGSGNVVPIFPPALPDVCGVGITKKKGGTTGGISLTGGKDKKKVPDPCGNLGGGTETPEPSTWFMMFSGLLLIGWMARHRLART